MLNILGSSNIVFLADQAIDSGTAEALSGEELTISQLPLSGASLDEPELARASVLVVAAVGAVAADQAISVIRQIRESEDLKTLPIICWGFSPRPAGAGSSSCFGLSFYLDAKAPVADVLQTVKCAVGSSNQFKGLLREVSVRESAIGLIRSGVFELKGLQEAENLATMLSRACPDPSVAAFALMEILVNAIEHGNLGLSHDEKSELLESGRLQDEIARRLGLPENVDKVVSVSFTRYDDRAEFTIKDAGIGFDWRRYMRELESDSDKLNGRGLTLACALECVDLSYSGNGNTATLVFR